MNRVQLACCVFVHNYAHRTCPVFDPQDDEAITRAPVFGATEMEHLADFINARVSKGRVNQIDALAEAAF